MVADELSRVDRQERIGHEVAVLLESRRAGVAVGLSREGVRVTLADGSPGERGEEVIARLVDLTEDGMRGVVVENAREEGTPR